MLTAAATRPTKLKLIAGAVIPAFNHAIRTAQDIEMLDAILQRLREAGRALRSDHAGL
jgi:alkanesulfonate monooxygenase SsuD/methylene tetrahydromethanopterin reductase-like flavin-dependent oxidoreductase (luciferase family)